MGDSKQGQIFIFATFVVVFLLSVGITYIFITRRQLKGREYQYNFQKALYIAEAGIEDAINVTLSNSSWRTGFSSKSFEGGTYTVTLTNESGNVRINSTSDVQNSDATRTVQHLVNITSVSSVTLQPSAADGKDSYVNEGSSGTNYANSNLTVGTLSMKDMYSLVEFSDLSEIPSSANVTVAKLFLFQYNAPSMSGQTISIRQITEDWNETGVTWTNKPSGYDSTVITSTSSGTTDNVWLNWNITSLCNAWHKGTKANQGIYLTGGNTISYFRSSDYTTDSTQTPKLNITYSPATVTVSDVSWQ